MLFSGLVYNQKAFGYLHSHEAITVLAGTSCQAGQYCRMQGPVVDKNTDVGS